MKHSEALVISVILLMANIISFAIGYSNNNKELMLLSGSAVLIFSLIGFVSLRNRNK